MPKHAQLNAEFMQRLRHGWKLNCSIHFLRWTFSISFFERGNDIHSFSWSKILLHKNSFNQLNSIGH